MNKLVTRNIALCLNVGGKKHHTRKLIGIIDVMVPCYPTICIYIMSVDAVNVLEALLSS